MKFAGYSLVVCACWALLSACTTGTPYLPVIKSLDSLGGVVGGTMRELERLDTVSLQKAVARYNYYRAFVKQNIHDTIVKRDADGLQVFFSAGATLQAISVNNKILRARGQLLSRQIAELAADLKDQRGDREQLIGYFVREQEETQRLVALSTQLQKTFYSALEEFRHALPLVEELIRRHNRGELPVVVKDSLQI